MEKDRKGLVTITLICLCVTGYIVEKQEEGSPYWDKVPGIVNGETHKVPGLQEGKKYKFRVKAENIYGVGEPLETDKPVLAKNPFGMYKLT